MSTQSKCPNCEGPLEADAPSCPKCGANFGPDSAWRPEPPGKSVPSRKPAPIAIAIAAAFLLSFFFSPGQKLVTLFIDVPMLGSMSPGPRGIALAIAGYWLPAAFVYVLLRSTRAGAVLTASRIQAVLLGIGNTVLILYVIARVFASTVPGGGAGFVVASFSTVTAFPALIMVGLTLATIVFRFFFGAKTQERSVNALPQLSFLQLCFVSIVGFVPVLYAISLLFFGPDSPFLTARKAERLMQALCATAGETIRRLPAEVEGIYLDQDSSTQLDVRNGVYQSSSFGILGEPLVNSGWLRFFETPSGRAEKQGTPVAPYLRYSIPSKKEPVESLASQYGVFRTMLTTPDDARLGTRGHEITVKELATNEVTAIKRYFYNHKTRRACGGQPDSGINDSDFIRRALGLQRRFESLFHK